MKKIIFLLLAVVANGAPGYAQENVCAFFEYRIKDGMEDQFINGYAKDLEWHQSQGDDWSWAGWFVLNGTRRDRFIDATPGHQWRDFDTWKVNGSENARYNKIHWLPYIQDPSGSYRLVMDEYSAYPGDWIKSKYQQVYRITIKSGAEADFMRFLKGFKTWLQGSGKRNPFVWMKTVSGGHVNEYHLFVGLSKIEDLAMCEGLFNFPAAQKELTQAYGNSVESNTAELWGYSQTLSLISAGK